LPHLGGPCTAKRASRRAGKPTYKQRPALGAAECFFEGRLSCISESTTLLRNTEAQVAGAGMGFPGQLRRRFRIRPGICRRPGGVESPFGWHLKSTPNCSAAIPIGCWCGARGTAAVVFRVVLHPNAGVRSCTETALRGSHR